MVCHVASVADGKPVGRSFAAVVDPPSATSGSGTAAAPPGAVDLVVLGAGVGGYTAAFRAADLGKKVRVGVVAMQNTPSSYEAIFEGLSFVAAKAPKMQ